jgi:hypothetical protein
MHEIFFNKQEEVIKPTTERVGGKDRCIHFRRVEQLLRLEHAEAEPIDGTDEVEGGSGGSSFTRLATQAPVSTARRPGPMPGDCPPQAGPWRFE